MFCAISGEVMASFWRSLPLTPPPPPHSPSPPPPAILTPASQVPTEPVVSGKTGHLFEKRLIEKYLASEDKCPVTGEELTTEDLIPLKATQTAKPRPITATSIPGLLSHFQNEWDALMLETYTLKSHLDSTRKELSQVGGASN